MKRSLHHSFLEETEDKVTKKVSQEFSRTERRFLAALSRLDDFPLNSLFRGHSGTAPETSRNAYGTKRGTNEDNCQSHPHPEAGIFQSQTTQNFGPEDDHDICLAGNRQQPEIYKSRGCP